jgi:ribosomal protein S19E (S16A)
MDQARQHSQEDVEDKILEVLEHGGVMGTQQIFRLVKGQLSLLPGDTLPAQKRPGEQMIDQIIANALQAQRRLCAKGLIERVDKGAFRITEKGRSYLSDFREEVVQMSVLLPDSLTHRLI